MRHPPEPPAFDARIPQETPGATAMRERVSHRLFGVGAPQRIGRYVIERRLGAGGMGVVYAAFDAELGRTVAIKLVRSDKESTLEQDRLRDEARSLAQLSHPNVVQIHEVGIHEGQLYLVMEYIEGRTLDVWAHDRLRGDILRCCIQAGRGLAAAHLAGLLHRDVKPNNIVVGTDGRVRVVDFGLARAVVSVPQTPLDTAEGEHTTHLVGTPAYLAPELYAGASASPASDQFGFCVTVWQLLAGARPFTAEQFVAAAEGAPLRPSNTLRPRWLRRALLRGLNPAASDRWPSIDALLDELEVRPRRRRLAATFATIAITVGLLAGLFFRTPAPSCPDPSHIFAKVWSPLRQLDLSASLASGAEAELLTRVVEAHRAAWIDTHASACQATRVKQVRSDFQLELAFACLDRDLAQLDSLLEIVETSAGDAFDLRRLLQELDDPRQCTASLQLAPPAELAPRVVALRERIDEVSLLLGIRPGEAGRGAAAVVVEARELDFAPVLAEALALDGKVAIELLDDRRALTSLREAARLAKALTDTRLEFACLRSLVRVMATQLEDPERAADFVALMLGSFEQLGRPPELLADVLVAQSELAQLRDEPQLAEQFLVRAVAHQRERLDSSDLRIERLEVALANVIAQQGRLDEAVHMYDEIIARLGSALGPRHPSVSTAEFNLAVTLYESGSLAGAREHVERALAIQREVYGMDSVKIAPLLILLAQARAGEGDVDGALEATREAWPLERKLAADNSDRGNALRLQAALLDYLGRYEEALETTKRIEIELGSVLSPLDRAMNEHSIGWLMCRVGQCERAGPRFHAALQSADPQVKLFARLGLVEVELAMGRTADARAQIDGLRGEIEQLPPSEGNAQAAAEAEFIRLMCIVADGASRAEIEASLVELEAMYENLDMPIYIQTTIAELEDTTDQ